MHNHLYLYTINKSNLFIMKKVLLPIIVVAISFLIPSTGLFAQLTTTPPSPTAPAAPVPLDEKTQKKVDKAKADLAKDQSKLTKATASYDKDKAKFEKDEAKGKLSPDKISKAKKDLANTEKEMAKLKKNIASNQAIIDKYMPAAPKM